METKLKPPNGGHLRTAAGELLDDQKVRIITQKNQLTLRKATEF